MKQLLQNWNKFLIEGVDPRIEKRIEYIKKYPGLGIYARRHGSNSASFAYCIIGEDGSITPVITKNHANELGLEEPWGAITIDKPGDCLDAWVVSASKASKGWGPLLYEVAIEWASMNGSGLTPDRTSVSDEALAVWEKYFTRDDIQKKQLDVLGGTPKTKQITPNEEGDDCIQDKSIEIGGFNGWMNTPTSKVYYKANQDTINALGKQFIQRKEK